MSYKDQAQIAERITLVIACDPADYHLWCLANGKSRRSSQYISGPEMLYGWGRVNVEIIGFPLWWTDEDMVQLEAIMERSRL